jgi:hypothetical protein
MILEIKINPGNGGRNGSFADQILVGICEGFYDRASSPIPMVTWVAGGPRYCPTTPKSDYACRADEIVGVLGEINEDDIPAPLPES